MKDRIIWKFFGAFVLLTFIAVFVLYFSVGAKLQGNFEEKISQELRSNAMLVGELMKDHLISGEMFPIQEHIDTLAERLALRITVIDVHGTVLGDSAEDSSVMENHRDRLEVAEAIEDGFGQSTRPSDTLGYAMKYVAVRIDDDVRPVGVVRFAMPLSKVQLERQVIYRIVLMASLVSVVISLTVAYFVSKGITAPISRMQQAAERMATGDFSCRVKVSSKDELGQLAKSLNAMADELEQKIENLRRMDRVRTDFVANVSHELKTPLTLIKGYMETLEGKALDDKDTARRFVSIISKHVGRLGNIIDDLLQLSELEASRDCISRAPCDLRILIDELMLGFGRAVEQKKQTLSVNVEGGDFTVDADFDKIEQVFVNLVDNAVKYTQEGGKIEILLADLGDNVRAVVRDNGIGIAAEHVGRVFERFYRVDKARSREVGGTGLGLGIAKHTVLAHNGAISIKSAPGKGTQVIVKLPKH